MIRPGLRLPVHPQPKPDESLSSLVLRVCRANWFKPQSLAHLLIEYPAFWQSDPDRLERDDVLTRLAHVLQLTPERIRATTLPSLAGKLFRQHNSCGNTRWVLPLGIYHSNRRCLGQQFCAACLRKDPYARLSWRLSSQTCCTEHHTLLQDCCPDCGAAVAFHRRDITVSLKNEVNRLPLTLCWNCGIDLAETSDSRDVLPAAVDLQVQLSRAQQCLDITVAGQSRPGLEVADVAYQVIKLLGSRRHRNLWALVVQARPESWSGPPPDAPHERLGVRQRHGVHALATALILDPPRFLEASAAVGLSASWVLRDMRAPPAWFADEVQRALGRKTDYPNFIPRWERGTSEKTGQKNSNRRARATTRRRITS